MQAEVDVTVDLEVELIANIELKSILNESVDEPIQFLAITREEPTEETDESVLFSFKENRDKTRATKASHEMEERKLEIIIPQKNLGLAWIRHQVAHNMDRFMMVTWSVWFHRNLYVWQDSNVSRASNRWIRSDNGRVKCNTDASVSIDDNATTYVVVLRDNTGNFIKGYTSFSHTKMEPHMVEGVVI
ncbi:hypothetical protein Gogos_009373 [Gossypium gossypioides]|uniref:RNase H type-1 domain-containing protein n=1 Tax=Gossypium gossypioides TaxID=34282 RepID=A0A7J9CED4_GOSGO|nr:hypothetical protein [Gossypium gossypioides]